MLQRIFEGPVKTKDIVSKQILRKQAKGKPTNVANTRFTTTME